MKAIRPVFQGTLAVPTIALLLFSGSTGFAAMRTRPGHVPASIRKPAAVPDQTLIDQFVDALAEHSSLGDEGAVSDALTRLVNENSRKLRIPKISSLDDIAEMSEAKQRALIEKLVKLPALTQELSLDSQAADVAKALTIGAQDSKAVATEAVPDLQKPDPVANSREAAAANAAGDLNGALAEAEAKKKVLNSIEFWQNFLGRQMTETEFQRSKISAFIGESIKTDRPYILVDYLQPMAYDVQLAYAMLKQAEAGAAGAGDALGYAKSIALGLDEYASAFGTLQKLSQGSGTAAKNAQLILNKLQSQDLLKSFFEQSGIEQVATPSLQDLYAVLDRYPEADLARLRQMRRQEAVSALLSISPTQTLFDAIGKWASDVPGADAGKIRLFLSSLQDEKIQYLYYPNIQRLAQSEGTMQDKLKMLEILNASTDNEFLTTLARRVDLSDLWNSLKAEAQKEKNTAFLQRMTASATAASKLDDLALWHDNSGMKIVARFVDATVASGIGYWAYKDTLGRPKPAASSSPAPAAGADAAKAAPQKKALSASDANEFDRILGWIEATLGQHPEIAKAASQN